MKNKIFILITVIVAVFGTIQLNQNNSLKNSDLFGAIYVCEHNQTFARSDANFSPSVTLFTLSIAVSRGLIAITVEATANTYLLATAAATIGIVNKEQGYINRNFAMAHLD